MASLEGWSSTIELHPLRKCLPDIEPSVFALNHSIPFRYTSFLGFYKHFLRVNEAKKNLKRSSLSRFLKAVKELFQYDIPPSFEKISTKLLLNPVNALSSGEETTG